MLKETLDDAYKSLQKCMEDELGKDHPLKPILNLLEQSKNLIEQQRVLIEDQQAHIHKLEQNQRMKWKF